MRWFAATVAALLLVLIASSGAAHPMLLEAVPEPGAVLAASPPQVRLVFSEPVAESSSIVIFHETFQEVAGIEANSDPESPEVVSAALPELLPDTYTVQWTVAGADGHEITGTYTFQVTGAGAVRSAAPVRQPAERIIPDGPLWPWIGLVTGLLAGLVVLITRWRRRA